MKKVRLGSQACGEGNIFCAMRSSALGFEFGRRVAAKRRKKTQKSWGLRRPGGLHGAAAGSCGQSFLTTE